LGRGFTVEEIKGAGLTTTYARTIGIAVDHRRRNKSEESLARNVQRLNEYKSKLVLYPRNSKKVLKGEASKEEIAKVTQLHGTVLPIKRTKKPLEVAKIAEFDQKTKVFETLRRARADAKLVGIRLAKAAKKAAATRKKAAADAARKTEKERARKEKAAELEAIAVKEESLAAKEEAAKVEREAAAVAEKAAAAKKARKKAG